MAIQNKTRRHHILSIFITAVLQKGMHTKLKQAFTTSRHICIQANAYTAKHLEEDLTSKVSDPTLLLYLKRSPLLSSYNVKFLHLDDSLQCTKTTCSEFLKSVSFQNTKHNSVTLKAKYTVLLNQSILVSSTECNWILSTVCLGCHSAM